MSNLKRMLITLGLVAASFAPAASAFAGRELNHNEVLLVDG
jgi:hypothetical protein